MVGGEEGGHMPPRHHVVPRGVEEGGGVVVEGVGGVGGEVEGGLLEAGGGVEARGGGVGEGGGVELRLGHHVDALLPVLGHPEVVHYLGGRRAGVVGERLGHQLAEQLLEVRVDGEGALARLAWAARSFGAQEPVCQTILFLPELDSLT